MSDEVEKVYCTGNGCSVADMAALMNGSGNSNSALTALMANGGMNNWMNNPWIYFVFLAMFGGGNMFGNRADATQNAEILSRVNELSSQMNNNQNTNLMMDAINGNHESLHALSSSLGVDFATLRGAIASVQNAITQVGGQVGYSAESVKNAIALGDSNIISKMQECCCSNKMLTQQMGYESQLRDQANAAALTSRIDQLANGVQTGFAQVGYAAQQNTAAIIQNATANTQRILDQMCSNTQQELRDKLAQMSQEAQTASIIAALKNSGCGCGCNS